MIELVTAASNTTLKRLRSLHEKKYRQREGLFLAEGLRICTEALDSGWVPEILLFAEGRSDQPLIRRLLHATLDGSGGKPGRVIETTPALLAKITGKANPQLVVAAYAPRTRSLERLQPGARMLVAEQLRDPGNLGTLLRACDATAASALILLDACADPTSVEAVRASMGACFTVPCVMASSAAFVQWKQTRGIRLLGAALDPRAGDYRAADYTAPVLLMVGNEAHGLPAALRDACDDLVIMPMRGRADSLNVAMAGTLLLYEALHAQERQAATLSQPGPNPPATAQSG